MSNPAKAIRVMIVDDSAVIRSIIDKILKTDSSIEVCGYASSGEHAVNTIDVCNPDVIILDIEMPVMDGITALPLLLKKKPNAKIFICSTLSDRGADVSVKALSLGATDCILKPSGPTAIQQASDFHTNLLRMVRSIGGVAAKVNVTSAPIKIRTPSVAKPEIVAIGSSTGGPNALAAILPKLKNLSVPIVITQHMPKTFTRVLAEHLTKTSGLTCFEGENNMILRAGAAYIAPGGFHMTFSKNDRGTAIVLNDGAPENFCKPAVDPMLRSLISIYGSKILTLILTGMGEDGLAGSRKIIETGGQVMAQDAATSVVWSMPGAVANAGLCSAVLPLNEIPDRIIKTCGQNLSTLMGALT